MPDMERVEKLTSILEERSGLDVREAVVRFYNYLSIEETRIYDKETDYLLDISVLRSSCRSDSG